MRPEFALLAAVLFVAGGCGTKAAETLDQTLTPDLFPFDAAPAEFRDAKDPAPRTLRIEPLPEALAVRMVFDVAGVAPRDLLRVTRRGASLHFSSLPAPDLGVELIRGGAQPGDAWESEGLRVTFDGWERLELPSSVRDAARVSTRRGPPGMEHVETWWFARGVGLLRLRNDRGGMRVEELIRSSP